MGKNKMRLGILIAVMISFILGSGVGMAAEKFPNKILFPYSVSITTPIPKMMNSSVPRKPRA